MPPDLAVPTDDIAEAWRRLDPGRTSQEWVTLVICQP
jgi:hypothetical protein